MRYLQRTLIFGLLVGTFQISAYAQKKCPLSGGECPFSQHVPEFGKQEIGLNAVSWINADVGIKGPKGGNWSYGNGLLYKAHCDKGALRAGLDVFHTNYEVGSKVNATNEAVPEFYKAGKVTTIEARLGVERTLCSSRLQPFIGVDMSYRNSRNSGEYRNYGGPLAEPTSGDINTATRQFLLSPLFGMRFRASEKFSIAAEASYSVGISNTRDNVAATNGEPEFVHFANPLRTLSVNYHF
ncbi:MAG: hypothetical protein KBA60_05200 [Flavobacteriales bacterium]|nr:hypothetical protein [Flavobacteriales bacterium]MBP7155382.1 hypothetical protein [Flavobacteriales bacterium]